MRSFLPSSLAFPLLAWALFAKPTGAAEPIELFNGKDLTGWVNVFGAAETWKVRDGILVCIAKASGFLRTDRMYQNYRFELEWRLLDSKSNSGVFLHADALPQIGAPFPRSLEAQIYGDDHGSLFGIRGFRAVPLTHPGKGHAGEARPLENRCHPVGEWNRYMLISKDGSVDVEVNGKLVTRVKECSLRKGYVAIQAESGEASFRNVRLTPLPGAQLPAEQIAEADEGLRPLFDGVTFAGWEFRPEFAGHWMIRDGVLIGAGQPYEKQPDDRELWTEREYGDFQLVVDWRLPKNRC